MKKHFFQLVSTLIVFLFVCVCFVTAASALTPPPGPTKTINPFATVNIPDPNLNTYLHNKTGVPQSDPLRRMDLSALTGTLEPKNLNISNAEGIQYCTNIEKIDMSNNNLLVMPNLALMKKLTTLNLSKNKFTSIPGEICNATKIQTLIMDKNEINGFPSNFTQLAELKVLSVRDNKLTAFPGIITGMTIETLNISNNTIKKLPDNIHNMIGLKYLYASDCSLTKLPDSIYNMTWIRRLFLDNNEISSLSKNIKNLTMLEAISIIGNKLEGLPDEICTLPNLKSLILMENEIYSIPSKIGDLKLVELYLNGNNLSLLPSSLKDIEELKEIDIRLNRLTKLPSGLNNLTYAYFNAEWNFLDISDGSATRQMLDNITATTEKAYMRQLTPMKNLKSEAKTDCLTLSWDKCPDGSANGATWKVTKYVVYLMVNGNMNKLGEVQSNDNAFNITGLTAATPYTYRVGVEYEVDDPPNSFKGTTRHYAEIDVKTAEASTASAQTSASEIVSASETPAAGSATASSPNSAVTSEQAAQSAAWGAPVWLIVIIIALGVLVTAAIVVVIILLTKKGPPKVTPPSGTNKEV